MRPVFDGHNDALTAEGHAQLASGKPGGHLDLPRMRAGGVRGAIFAVFAEGPTAHPTADGDAGPRKLWGQPVPDPPNHNSAAGTATRAAGRLAALELAGEVAIARTTSNLDAVHDHPALPPAAVLHVEGAEAIDPELEALPFWYEAGLRSLGLVWSRPNWFGEGVPYRAPSSPDTGAGLTASGRRLVARCGELGILVDLSHLNERGFWDVARIDAGPLVASHSGAHTLSQNSRNLTDAQLDAIGSSGGLIGIMYGPAFLRQDFAEAPDTPIELIASHAAYVAERIGVEHVGLGSDFDGTMIPDELGDVAGTPKLLDALAAAGFSEAELDAIAWDNWRRVIGAWWRE